jgi:hypothetical protein
MLFTIHPSPVSWNLLGALTTPKWSTKVLAFAAIADREGEGGREGIPTAVVYNCVVGLTTS